MTDTKHLKRRYAAERRFKAYGIGAIALALGFLAILLVTIFSNGATAFVQTKIHLDVTFDAAEMGLGEDRSPDALASANYLALVRNAIAARFPAVETRSAKRELAGLLSQGAEDDLRKLVRSDPAIIGTTRKVALLASDDVDMAVKGHGSRLTEQQTAWLAELEKQDAARLSFNDRLFTSGDSREPEQAGLWGAIVGSFFSLSVTLLVCFPLGVATA
ncbi:MAG TPA: DUF3333 domain-containing protein, partial [Candidatus Omnitrophota bacterium]|nr:DUF3333 domain-containing protein [Candidatus Omnitrophota bacterium]